MRTEVDTVAEFVSELCREFSDGNISLPVRARVVYVPSGEEGTGWREVGVQASAMIKADDFMYLLELSQLLGEERYDVNDPRKPHFSEIESWKTGEAQELIDYIGSQCQQLGIKLCPGKWEVI